MASSSSSNTSAEEEESYDSGSEFTRESTDDELNVDHLISPNINATVASVLERRFEQAVPLMNPNAGQLWFLI